MLAKRLQGPSHILISVYVIMFTAFVLCDDYDVDEMICIHEHRHGSQSPSSDTTVSQALVMCHDDVMFT